MTVSQVPLNLLVSSEPELKDALDLLKRDIFLSFNCHQVAVVQAFDPVKQTVTAQIPYKKTFYERNPVDGTYAPVLVDYPLLVDVPAFSLGGGGFSLTLPVSAGDECLILFNDRDLDNWFSGQTGGGVASARAHSFADGLALVGIRSLPNVITGFNGSGAELRNRAGTCKVTVGATAVTLTSGTVTVGLDLSTLKVTISNGTTTLGTALTALVTDLSTMATGAAAEITTQAGASTGPLAPLQPGFTSLAATFTTLGTALGTVATQLSGLLA